MNKSIAFLFPGQGAQYVGMGKSLYDNIDECREIFDEAEEILEMPIKQLIFEGPEEDLTATRNNQLAILITSLACQKALELEGIEANYVAGLSLGEYSALVYGGAITFEDGINIVKKRAAIMDSALDRNVGSMAAVLKLDKDRLNKLLEEASQYGVIEAANYNCPGQVVVSGEVEAVKACVGIAKSLKGMCIPLKVSGPFHSSLYEKASYDFYEELKKIDIDYSEKTIYSNVLGKPYSEDDDMKDLLRKQIMTSVLFEDSIKDMIEKGVNTFIELGPGKTLTGFVKKIDKNANVYNIQDLESLKETVQKLKEEVFVV